MAPRLAYRFKLGNPLRTYLVHDDGRDGFRVKHEGEREWHRYPRIIGGTRYTAGMIADTYYRDSHGAPFRAY